MPCLFCLSYNVLALAEIWEVAGTLIPVYCVDQGISMERVVSKIETNEMKEEDFMARNNVRIKLKAYEHRSLDAATEKIVKAAEETGVKKVVGPIPLPTEKQVVTVLRAVHKYKDSREQFEVRTHKRLVEIIGPSPKTIDALSRLELPSGVDIEIKL